ncbi:hypothetical protein ZIOFF_021904 [Zingiber officinale]|uniref:Uncharacterized protein n=1 Tax=Zingiber officinale TaxID=94328 RepID=A0A8J5H7N2_ZINOF|nr:hypothetical protein ZIOFF_021904 [Zingiber officinale]
MVKKRGKGSVAEIQENITNKLSRMDSNNSANSSEDLHGKEPIADEKIDKKKGRGASKLKMVSGQDKCKELERNEFDGWSDIDEEVKDRMWSCLQMTYKVEDWEKKTIFQKLAKLWPDRKSKLQILVREANTSRVASRDLSLLKPEFMDQNQWDMFVQRTLSSTFQKKILECPPESQNTTNIADDAISIVFGNEARGRVRGMGFGVTPSKVEASVQQNGMVQQLQTILQNVQQQMQEMRQQNQLEMQEMRSMFLQSMRQQNHPEQIASGGICSGIGNEFGSNSDINIGAKKSGDFGHVFQAADELVVAEGRIASTDPNTKVHHVILGGSCWKVWVDKVLHKANKQIETIKVRTFVDLLKDLRSRRLPEDGFGVVGICGCSSCVVVEPLGEESEGKAAAVESLLPPVAASAVRGLSSSISAVCGIETQRLSLKALFVLLHEFAMASSTAEKGQGKNTVTKLDQGDTLPSGRAACEIGSPKSPLF